VLEEACRQTRAWQQLGPGAADLQVNVNLHVVQIVPQKLAAQVCRVLAATGLAATSLNVEISEGVLLQGTATAFATLGELRALGLGVCLDDFGTGYSSLANLPSFPVTTLKIDRSFVGDLHQSGPLAIVEAMTSLAHNLGIAVVAEGLETEEQLAALRRMGCEQAQGFLLSRPLPGADAFSLLAGAVPWQERCFSSLAAKLQ
jgi:EAL domain-containing protein (putative c-di-GMP-specific phosphodiesterase class I)